MASTKVLSRGDLLRFRSELSIELKGMTKPQRIKYLKAAKEVYEGLSKMTKIRDLTMA